MSGSAQSVSWANALASLAYSLVGLPRCRGMKKVATMAARQMAEAMRKAWLYPAVKAWALATLMLYAEAWVPAEKKDFVSL